MTSAQLFDLAWQLTRDAQREATTPMTREQQLLQAAADALRYFDRQSHGGALNGPHEDIRIGRELHAALNRYLEG